MPPSGYRRSINTVRNGEQVSAGVTNRAPTELLGNTDYLKELYEAAFLGQAVIAREQIVAPTVLENQFVWFNPTTQRFEQALAGATTDDATGELVLTSSSYVWGLAINKIASTTADIVLVGMVEVDPTNLLGASQEVTSGLWYLSGNEAGKIVPRRLPSGVPVCLIAGETAEGNARLFISPAFRDDLDRHRHYRFELVCEPAGAHEPPALDTPHEITDADPTKEGWLPADHEIFDDKAPPGALFGYNIARSDFATLWPPLPLQSAFMELSRGDTTDVLGCSVPMGLNQLLVVDANGIWWLTNCYGQVPWPTDWGETGSTEASDSVDECPRLPLMQGVLWFSRPTFHSASTVVLSLQPADESLLITCLETGEPATTGNLVAKVNLQFEEEGSLTPGYAVFKSVDGLTFQRGPVVESVIAGTENVTVVGTGPTLAGGHKTGRITISVTDQPDGLELPLSTDKLNGVTLEFYADVMTYGFAEDRTSSLRGEILVPARLSLPDGSQIKIGAMMLGRAAGTVPEALFNFTYRRIPNPNEDNDPVSLPDEDDEGAFLSAATFASADQYVRVESEPFEIEAGDTIQFTIERPAPDSFTGEVQLFCLRGIIVLPE